MSTTPTTTNPVGSITAGVANMQYTNVTENASACRAEGYNVDGLDVSNCGLIIAARAATLATVNTPAPVSPIRTSVLPAAVQSDIAACDAEGTSCKFLAFDFDVNEGKRASTLTHVINTRETTAHNAGIFYKHGNKPPTFNTIPGYVFDGTFSFDTTGRTPLLSTVIDERYCARTCDNNPFCTGFNYQAMIRMCTVFTDEDLVTSADSGVKAMVYKNGIVSFTKEPINKTATGTDPLGTNLTTSGAWCGSEEQIAACNADITNVIQNSSISAFSTADLESCAACPVKEVARVGATSWAVTNEIETTVITNSPAETITSLNYKGDPSACESRYTRAMTAAAGNATAMTAATAARTACLATHGRPTTKITLVPGKFYKLSPYVQSSAFVAKTCLFMKNVASYTVVGATVGSNGNNRFLLSGATYTIPIGIYTGPQFVSMLNTLGTGGIFGFADAANRYEWRSDVSGVFEDPAALLLLGFKRMARGKVIQGTQLPPNNNGGFMTYYSHALPYSAGQTGKGTDKMFVFATLGSNASETPLAGEDPVGGENYNETQKRLTPIIVDYVDNGIILMNSTTGEYMIPAVDDSKTTFARNKYSASYNALIVRVTDSSFQDFINELTAINAEQPLIIRKTLTDPPFMIDPTPDPGNPPYRAADPSYFQIQQFPSMSTYNSYLTANPTWAKYIDRRTLNVATSRADTSIATVDMKKKTLVKSVNFWNTVRFSETIEIADPTYGCADPDDLGASYTGGECILVRGTQTSGASVAPGAIASGIMSFCQKCSPGSYSLRTNNKTICDTNPTNALDKTWCTPCILGDYCEGGKGTNPDCPAGHYCPTPSIKMACEPGYYCPARTWSPRPCIAGDYCPASSSAALDCEAGSYCPSVVNKGVTIWGSEQTECPGGSYCIPRSTTHTMCPNTCPPVPATVPPSPAYYCPPGTRTLNLCPAGFACPNTTTKQECMAGTICPFGSCGFLPCLNNTYFLPQVLTNIQGILQDQVNTLAPRVQCYMCPVGTNANSDNTGCVCTDPQLRWSPYNNKCITDCPIGQSANPSGLGCANCVDNTYTPVTGLPKCMPCASNFTSTANSNKSGCVCTETIANGTLQWDGKWNRCKVICTAGTHVPYWARCKPIRRDALVVGENGGSPVPGPIYGCPTGSNNEWGEGANKVCHRKAESKKTSLGGYVCDFSCPSGWTKNGGGSWNDQPCTRTLSCYRNAIVLEHSCGSSSGCSKPSYSYKGGSQCPVGSTYNPADQKCHMAATATTTWTTGNNSQGGSGSGGANVTYSCPANFTLSGSDCSKAPVACPTGFTGPYCNIPPASIKDVSSNGFDGTQYDVSCVFAGGTNTSCYTCPSEYPTYLGPTYDTAWTGLWKMRCDISTASLSDAVSPTPWGNDSNTPRVDSQGNILWPSIVTQALRSIGLPDPDSSIPCTEGYYMPVRGPGAGAADPTGGGVAITLVNGIQPGNCIACDPGNYCGRGYREQVPCPGGFKCRTPAVIERCVAGEICPEGQANPRICRAGYYCSSASIVQETVCPAGSFCVEGVDRPTLCNTGKYCPVGSISETDCPSGSYCRNPETITGCQAGTYCPSGSSAEIQCPPGSYCPAGSGSAITCAQGKYCPAGSTQQHDQCPAGFYCLTPMSMTACPAGTYSTTVGATSASTCLPCPAGYTCPYTGTVGSVYPLPVTQPTRCSAGQYCPAGSDTFALCPPGWYCPTPATQIRCANDTVCPAGSISMGPEQKRQVASAGVETCRAICARGMPGVIPAEWNGATCIAVTTNPNQVAPPFPYSCESVPRVTVSCRCQIAKDFGWIV